MKPKGCYGEKAVSVSCHGCANEYNDKECIKIRRERQLEFYWE